MEKQESLEQQKASLPTFATFVSAAVIVLALYLLFSGETFRFYASFLFLFYFWIKRMWLAVIGLGIFQTMLMIPFRVINLSLSVNVKEFEEKVEETESEKEQQFLIKENVKKGNPIILWYMVNFVLQTISYLSIGRMFLIDFYNTKLDPKMLYSFVPYPAYPIQDRIFQLPYIAITEMLKLGWGWVLLAWLAGLVYKLALTRLVPRYRKYVSDRKIPTEKKGLLAFLRRAVRQSGGYLTIYMFLSWLIIRHFPQAWELRIFTGDISVPNYTLNAVTAIGAGTIIFWLNMPKILNKGELARSMGVAEEIISKTMKKMFKETLRSAALLGLGAYYITRLIPSAFELSIFTLEIITLLSPFTLDRLIFSRGKALMRLRKEVEKTG